MAKLLYTQPIVQLGIPAASDIETFPQDSAKTHAIFTKFLLDYFGTNYFFFGMAQ